MSCNSNCYLPIPPRAWSRVQNSCSLFDENTYSGDALVPLPYSGRLVPASTLYLEYAMLNKGNVLQYKKNSSNLTKQQRYAQIAKGKWVNRNTTWATQSTRGYTNPNNQSLQRVGNINITLDGQPTLAPVTCPKPFTPVNELLPGTSSSGSNPEVIPPPPPPPTTNTGTELPPTIIEPPVAPIVIPDLGNLVCGTQENVCTGELIRQPTDVICHPTSDSDVPGPIMELCWNDGNPTWYPRQRYVMTNSGNKWPVNYKLLVSAVTANLPPFLTLVNNTSTSVTLSWTIDAACLPISGFDIYQNFVLVATVSFPTNIITINNLIPGILYVFSVDSFSNTTPEKTYSGLSNYVSNSSMIFSTTGNPILYVQGNEYVIEFINNGSITFNYTYNLTYVCCGGGGGGGGGTFGNNSGGGGGGGGGGNIQYGSLTSNTSTYTVTIGSGGSGGNGALPSGLGFSGSNGGNSSFIGSITNITALGGGGGGGSGDSTVSPSGGNGGISTGTGGAGGTNATGGNGNLGGGGGGGGGNGSPPVGGNRNGGDGAINVAINNVTKLGAGGGAGGANNPPGKGGNQYAGGGGDSSIQPANSLNGFDGASNKGGGGGGGEGGNGAPSRTKGGDGGNGGSGIVLIYLQIT